MPASRSAALLRASRTSLAAEAVVVLPLASPVVRSPAAVIRLTASWRSTRSSSGPDSRPRYLRRAMGVQLHPASESRPHGQGFAASTSWTFAGNRAVAFARCTVMTPLSSGWRSASSVTRLNSGASTINQIYNQSNGRIRLTKTAAIYTRISKDKEGREVGVQRQERLCRELAESLGLSVVAVFSDNDISASRRSRKPRPGYEELLRRAREGDFAKVLAYSTSRLTRRPRQFEDWIDLFDEKGVVVHSVNVKGSNYDLSTAQGRGDARRRAASDAEESDEISERVKAAVDDRALRGEWHGGPPPFGYRRGKITETVVDEDTGEERERVRSIPVPEPSEVALLEQAARRLLNDREATHSIVKDWTERDIRTRQGKHWRQSNLRAILLNRSLLGETKAGVKGWEPVLDQRTFDRLQALFSDPARKVVHSPGVKGGTRTMGGGLTVCGKCGKPLVTQRKSRADGKDRFALGCRAETSGPSDQHPAVTRTRGKVTRTEYAGRVLIDHDALEEVVFDALLDSLNKTPRFRERMAEPNPENERKVDALEAERSALRDERARAGRAFIAGIMTEHEAQREVARVDAALAQVEVKITELLRGPVVADLLRQGEDWNAWRDWNPGKRRAFLRLFINKVEVYDPKVVPRTSRKSGESDESLAKRRHDLRIAAVRARIHIDWKKGA